ncbi:hypothetical protein C0991_003878 [Blastosporella zonata]|nr:hypothetical protein C0991_003878 [Blastosporella zonata]
MFSLASFALALSAVSSVSAVVVPRATPPSGWAISYLEATQKASTALAAQCLASTTSSSSAATPTPTASNDDDECDEGDDDCDCYDDDDTPTSVIATSTSTKTPTPTTTSTKAPSPTTTSAKTTTSKTSTIPAQISTTRAQPTAATEATNTGGFATFFYQNGVAGACGTVHKDNDLIAAMDKDRYGDLNVKSSLCGQQVKITNTANGKSVIVTVADACPTCKNSNSIDLSVGAFTKIATEAQGMVPITWAFVN